MAGATVTYAAFCILSAQEKRHRGIGDSPLASVELYIAVALNCQAVGHQSICR